MNYEPSEVLKTLQSTLGEYTLLGDSHRKFQHPTSLWNADKESITFCTKEHTNMIPETTAGVIIAPKETPGYPDKTIIAVDDPRIFFLKILNHCFPVPQIHQPVVHPTVKTGEYCVLKNCVIGANTILKPGCIIGGDGFGYYKTEDGLRNFPHHGRVIIGENVEIGSCTCIDRGSLNDTVIHDGVKIDNLVHVAHNVEIGEDSLIIAHAMIGGSVKIGRRVWVAPGAVLRDNISIGDDALIGLGSVVTKNVPSGVIVYGNPAKEHPKK